MIKMTTWLVLSYPIMVALLFVSCVPDVGVREHEVSYPTTTHNFTFTPKNGSAPLAVAFTNLSHGEIDTYLWEFGDGNISTERNPIHIYSSPGRYFPTLTVKGPGGSKMITLAFPVNVSPAVSGTIRLNMKSYGNHNEYVYSDMLGWINYDERILTIRPEMIIDNPPHGMWGEMGWQQYGIPHNENDWLLQNIAEYQAAGIKVFGYLTCGYEGGIGVDQPGDGYDPYWYELETNKMLIRNMAELDHVDGVFIDECSDFFTPDRGNKNGEQSKAYLKELVDLAHSYGLLVWGVTGTDEFDEWFFTQGGFDFIQSSEDWRGQELSQVQRDWGHRISVTGFCRYYTAKEAYDLTIDAWEKGLAYCYINKAEYTTIAPWFEEYVAMLRGYGQDSASP